MGGKKPMLPPRGAFVVVVVVVTDNKGGTPSYPGSRHAKALGEAKYRRERRRQARKLTP